MIHARERPRQVRPFRVQQDDGEVFESSIGCSESVRVPLVRAGIVVWAKFRLGIRRLRREARAGELRRVDSRAVANLHEHSFDPPAPTLGDGVRSVEVLAHRPGEHRGGQQQGSVAPDGPHASHVFAPLKRGPHGLSRRAPDGARGVEEQDARPVPHDWVHRSAQVRDAADARGLVSVHPERRNRHQDGQHHRCGETRRHVRHPPSPSQQ